MANKDKQNEICNLLMCSFLSLLFMLICIISEFTGANLYPIVYKILPVVNLYCWFRFLYNLSLTKQKSSIYTKIFITLISIALIYIAFFLANVLYSSVCILLITLLLVNYFIYLLEYTEW